MEPSTAETRTCVTCGHVTWSEVKNITPGRGDEAAGIEHEERNPARQKRASVSPVITMTWSQVKNNTPGRGDEAAGIEHEERNPAQKKYTCRQHVHTTPLTLSSWVAWRALRHYRQITSLFIMKSVFFDCELFSRTYWRVSPAGSRDL